MIHDKCPKCELPNMENHWHQDKDKFVCMDCFNGKSTEQIIAHRKRYSSKYTVDRRYYENNETDKKISTLEN